MNTYRFSVVFALVIAISGCGLLMGKHRQELKSLLGAIESVDAEISDTKKAMEKEGISEEEKAKLQTKVEELEAARAALIARAKKKEEEIKDKERQGQAAGSIAESLLYGLGIIFGIPLLISLAPKAKRLVSGNSGSSA